MSIIYGLDPGTIQSAIIGVSRGADGRLTVTGARTLLNPDMIALLRRLDGTLVIEQIESMGMAVGQEVFATVWWAGRFYQTWDSFGGRYQLPRRPIKLHLCGTMQAKDANIRRALLDKFGGDAAIGRKAAPGPLYGVKGHEFAALAVAVTWLETQPITRASTVA